MEPRVDNRLEVQQTQKLSQNLQTAIHLLTLDLDGLSDYVSQAIQENPALEYVPPKKSAQDYAMRVRTRYRGSRGEYSGDSQTASPETPLADLEQQLRLSDLDTWTFRAADSVLHLLTNRGYFEQDLNEFAAEAGVDPGTAEAALKAIQALEPAGIGARTVEECLCLQLRDRPDADPLCRELICHHLEDISRGKIKEIAKATGATQARIRACVETIRSLNPSPCSLREEAVQYIMPEFSVEKGPDGKLSILFHNDYYPSFRQDVNFMRLTETLQGEEETYARRMQTSAAQLIRAVEMRQATMEKLAKMPSREVLLARLVGSMSATIGNFVRVIEAIRKKQAGEE